MNILGLNTNHADTSAALIVNGEVVSAVEEERFKRIKHFSGFPNESINYCLNFGNIKLSDLDYIALNYDPNANVINKSIYFFKNIYKKNSWKKLLNLNKKILSKSNLKKYLKENGFNGQLVNIEHHLSHLFSSLALSEFDDGIGLTLDGFGDFSSLKSYYIKDKTIHNINTVNFPHSLGIFYQAITQYLGFRNYGDEYKVMGLASYGKPIYLKEFSNIINYCNKNYFRLNLNYFQHHKDINFAYSFHDGIPKFDDLYSEKLIELFGKSRKSDDEINDHHMNIAASMQKVFEDIVISILKELNKNFKFQNLYLSGGCALNSKFNGLIKKKTDFENIFIQPNSSDGGGSLGAAVAQHYNVSKELPSSDSFVYLGPSFTNEEIKKVIELRNDIKDFKIKYLQDDEIYKIASKKIYENLIIGWFKGRMEWGPRALGNRSILANPCNKNIKDILNLKIKLREKFRPFAPAIIFEDKRKLFDLNYSSPFMLNVVEAKEGAKNLIPSTVHVDNTCRVQTVSKSDNLHFYNLIKEFKNLSGVPVILNTSFNENEPIVLSPKEAIDCFVRTKMDFLVMENWTISR